MAAFTSPNWNPEWIWGIALIVLGCVFAYGAIRAGRRSRQSSAAADQATTRLYEQEENRDRSRDI